MPTTLPALNCLIYGYATAMPRGFFNQAKFVAAQKSKTDALTQELVEIFEPIMEDRIKAAMSLMGEADKLSKIMIGMAAPCSEYNLEGYASWEDTSYNIAKQQFFEDDACKLMYLLGYDTGSFFGNLSFLIVILDFCLEAEGQHFALASQFMNDQNKLYYRLESYAASLGMLPKSAVPAAEEVFFKGGLQPIYEQLLQVQPQSAAEWRPVFEQLKSASMLLDQKFGDLIKALM